MGITCGVGVSNYKTKLARLRVFQQQPTHILPTILSADMSSHRGDDRLGCIDASNSRRREPTHNLGRTVFHSTRGELTISRFFPREDAMRKAVGEEEGNYPRYSEVRPGICLFLVETNPVG